MKGRIIAIIKGLPFLALAVLLAWLLVSGSIELLVHPRMKAWTAVAAALAAAIGIASMAAPRSSAGERLKPLAFLPLALVMAASCLYVARGSLARGPDLSREELAFFAQSAKREADKEKARARAKSGELPLVLDFTDDDSFYPLFERVRSDIPAAAGRRVVVEGFAYREEGFPSGTLFVTRRLMWCCAADMTLVGFVARHPEADSFPTGQWIRVDGTLSCGDPEDPALEGEAVILNATVVPKEKTGSEIVYP